MTTQFQVARRRCSRAHRTPTAEERAIATLDASPPPAAITSEDTREGGSARPFLFCHQERASAIGGSDARNWKCGVHKERQDEEGASPCHWSSRMKSADVGAMSWMRKAWVKAVRTSKASISRLDAGFVSLGPFRPSRTLERFMATCSILRAVFGKTVLFDVIRLRYFATRIFSD